MDQTFTIMKHILAVATFSLIFLNCSASQSISGTFAGDRIKSFRFTEKYWYVDGFGSHKMKAIEYTKDGILSTYKFKTDTYESWFETAASRTFLVIGWRKCKSCKYYRFTIKKIKNTLIR